MVTKKKAVKKLQPYEIGELDHYLFGQGNHYEIYKKFGAHEVTAGKKGVYFAVWAPHAKSVSVIGEFNGWDAAADRMERQESTQFLYRKRKTDRCTNTVSRHRAES